MKKEDLMALGLTEEQAEKVLRAVEGNYIPKTRFDEAGEETKALKKSLSDRDKQLETLKKSSGDNAELQKQISDLQQQNEEQKKVYEAEQRIAGCIHQFCFCSFRKCCPFRKGDCHNAP